MFSVSLAIEEMLQDTFHMSILKKSNIENSHFAQGIQKHYYTTDTSRN